MGDREKKYKKIFLGEQSIVEQEATGHSHHHKTKLEKTPEVCPGYDSDDERENAHMMFIDDLQFLRKTFIQSMEQQVEIQEAMQAKFNKEREFFLESAQQGQNNTNDLQSTIDQLR